MKYFKHFLLGLMWLAAGCNSSDNPRIKDEAYLPLMKGLYHIYEVDEIRYGLGVPETLKYHLKTVVIDSFLNANSDYTYLITRSRRMEGNDKWEKLESWSVSRGHREVIVTEGNIPFVTMIFPLQEKRSWDGNKYNTLINPTTKTNEDLYTLQRRDVDVTLPNGQSFKNCIEIEQEDNQEYIVFFDQRKEIYAAGIGLIQKEVTRLSFCNDHNRDCIGKQIVDNGIIFKQQLKEYGRE